MPATVFNPFAALIVHSQVPVNPLTFTLMENEEALLIHGCRRSATRQEWRRYNKSGKLIVFVRHSPLLTYSVSATALDPTGENLGNYHPGRCLSDRTLAFINGGRTPFQFEKEVEGVVPGKFILLNPTQEPGAGDATEVDFTIEHAFIDLDVVTYPGGGTATPDDPVLFVEIPEQAVADLTAACCTAILADIFHNANSFAAGPLTATLYNGDPGSGGVAVSDALPLSEWTAVDEPGAPSVSRIRNHAVLEWLDASGFDRTVTHVLWARNGISVAVRQLNVPLVVPAYYGVRAPIHALAFQLSWPLDGDMGNSWVEAPARVALRYLFGAASLQPVQTTLYVNCWNGDPHGSGSGGIADNGLSLARTSGGWTIAGSTVSSAAAVSGTFPAPPGGWTIPFVTVGIPDVQTWWIVREFDPPLFVPEGGTLSIDPGDFTVTIG